MKCEACGGKIDVRVLDTYRADTMIGLRNVTVAGEAREYRCGDPTCATIAGVSIPDMEGLQASLAVHRVMLDPRLSGDEIRFLRGTLGLKAKEVAQLLEVSPETVSRWENEKKLMEPEMEKLLRLSVGFILTKHAPAVAFNPDEILKMSLADSRQGQALGFCCRRLPVLMRQCEHRLEEQTGWRMQLAAAA